ncbi:putative flippase GtrA [Paenibacillus castaneae]|uniref:GtrA family protein n=1 Tax=Paenibacillus castaneae TaxID=474957 RepID=UPI000C9B008D|nr:GtrA family protein [Paenibacillus castaneae]NIK78359.1 putative flippase GtrA [Paenibacillus castaneae]
MRGNKREIITYIIFGILTTAINLIVYVILTKVSGIDYRIATTIAWIVSILFAFITNKIFVFRNVNRGVFLIVRELMLFVAFRVLSFVLDIILLIALIQILQMDDLISKVITNVLVVILNYIASKVYIFKSSKQTKEV